MKPTTLLAAATLMVLPGAAAAGDTMETRPVVRVAAVGGFYGAPVYVVPEGTTGGRSGGPNQGRYVRHKRTKKKTR